MRDAPEAGLRCLNIRSFRYHERCWLIQTAGRWSWKSKSAKECVTTHLPNQVALKMDGAQANNQGVTALMFACDNNHEQCARALIEAKADLEKQTDQGNTALMLSCQNGHEHT
eukprot:UN02439